jgi:hypothetical protein
VIKHLFGSREEFFKKLPRLLLAMKESNLETVVDETHKENLELIAISFDVNNGIFSLAFAIVDEENNDN